MKLWSEIKQEFLDQFSKKWSEREALSQWKLILEYLSIPTREPINQSVSPQQSQELKEIIYRLANDEPIQYVLGKAWFDDLAFIVTSDVLIPRQETEELVYWIVNEHKQKRPKRILDIGTGSGCIAIALAKHFPDAEIIGWDISAEALKIANQNKESLSIPNVSFQQVDILSISELYQTFDIIVSNPPYIPKEFSMNMESQVTKYEPQLALFVPNHDPLLFYRKIAELVPDASNSILYYEINEFYKDQTVELLTNMGYKNVIVKQDLNGNWRMVRAY